MVIGTAVVMVFVLIILAIWGVFGADITNDASVNGTIKRAVETLAEDATKNGCVTQAGYGAAMNVLQGGGLNPELATVSTTISKPVTNQAWGTDFTVTLSYPWTTGGFFGGTSNIAPSASVSSAYEPALGSGSPCEDF